MELGEREFEKIGEYVKSHLKEWISESGVDIGGETGEQRPPTSNPEVALALRNRELDLIERVVRVEDELKNLREVMEERFEAQRELMDERFSHMEKRTAFVQWGIGIGFTAILVLMGVLNYLG